MATQRLTTEAGDEVYDARGVRPLSITNADNRLLASQLLHHLRGSLVAACAKQAKARTGKARTGKARQGKAWLRLGLG